MFNLEEFDLYEPSCYNNKMKQKSAAAIEMGKKSAERFKKLSKEEKSEYFRQIQKGKTPTIKLTP